METSHGFGGTSHCGQIVAPRIGSPAILPQNGRAKSSPSAAFLKQAGNTNMADRQTSTHGPLGPVRDIAKELAHDVVFYVTNITTSVVKKANTRYAKTMRRVVDEILEKHEILFKGMVKKLQVSEQNIHATIDNIANQMMVDGLFNWGRLATLYAFSGLLAKHCHMDKNSDQIVEKIAVYTGDYVAEHLSEFIRENGGWDAFEEYFPEPEHVENTIWRGLLYTVVGLGAIATMVSSR